MFKDDVATDLEKVFINTSEHGEIAVINGTNINVVQDNDHLEYKLRHDTMGILTGDILFYISDIEYAKIPNVKSTPRTGEAVIYNSKPATICDVVSNMGLYEITLQFSGAR